MAYIKDKDYQAEIDQAVARGDYAAASRAEQERNEKIDGENLPYEKTNKYVIPNGVSDETYNQQMSQHKVSDDVLAKGTERDSAANRVNEVTNKDNIVSEGVYTTLGRQFETPLAVQQADRYLSEQLQKIQSGKTSYSDKLSEMMDTIMNREKFSYDVDTDPLFQQALASAMNSGKQAMQDTIGQASALTGGYGSTYATSAGNQAYNAYIEDAYDNLPQYYNMAMQAYQMEGDELYRQYGMLYDADATEYNRNVTAYDATSAYRNQLYNEAYGQFRDTKTDAINYANLQISEHNQLVNDAYTAYNVAVNEETTAYERDYQDWMNMVNQANTMAGMQQTDWWNQKEFDENVRQYDQSFAEQQRQFDTSFAEQQRQYNESLAEQKRQHNEQMSYNWASLNAKASGGGSGGSVGDDVAIPGLKLSVAQFNSALQAYDNAGGGEAGLIAAGSILELYGIKFDEETATILYDALEANSTLRKKPFDILDPNSWGNLFSSN